MKRWLTGVLAAGILFCGIGGMTAEAAVAVPKDIYEWVQSTARAGYYFNKQQMNYVVRADGTIDLNTLSVPVLKIYDPVQIQDVVSKRRWKMMNCEGYDDLAGAAEYLEFDLAAGTVQVKEHDDLDSLWGTLSVDKTANAPISLEKYSEKDVDGIFYRAILQYAEEHRDEFIARSKGVLSKEDAERLEKEKQEKLEAEKKALEEQKKAEKEREKQLKKEKRKNKHKK